jgi:hypothetical protein
VQPSIEKEERFSFVSSEPRAIDLDRFKHLAKRGLRDRQTARWCSPMGKTHLARRVVAEVELATPASERRLVQTDDFNETGGVYLELADATPAWAATP